MVFDDKIFSPNRLKISFISVVVFWAGLIVNAGCSIVKILLCIL